MGHFLYNIFSSNNDLYNGAKIVNLPLVVVEISGEEEGEYFSKY